MYVCTVENDAGRRFNVRLVRRGDRYGLNDCLTHGSEKNPIPAKIASDGHDGAMIEFYDETYANVRDFGPLGQFVTRYYLSTLTTERSHVGLDLHCGVDSWKINATNVRDAIASCLHALAS